MGTRRSISISRVGQRITSARHLAEDLEGRLEELYEEVDDQREGYLLFAMDSAEELVKELESAEDHDG